MGDDLDRAISAAMRESMPRLDTLYVDRDWLAYSRDQWVKDVLALARMLAMRVEFFDGEQFLLDCGFAEKER